MFEAPAKDTIIKVTALNVAFYLSPSTQAEKAYLINPAKENKYKPWEIGSTVKATGNVLTNAEGTFIEVTTLRWYRKNFLSGWFPVPVTAYYRAEDQTANWVSNTIVGIKPPITPTKGTGTETGNPNPNSGTDNTLQKVGIGIGIISLLIALRK